MQKLDATLSRFVGTIEQVPPMHSALKHDGQPLYKLARAGSEVERAPRQISVHRLALVERMAKTSSWSRSTAARARTCECWPKTSDARWDVART